MDKFNFKKRLIGSLRQISLGLSAPHALIITNLIKRIKNDTLPDTVASYNKLPEYINPLFDSIPGFDEIVLNPKNPKENLKKLLFDCIYETAKTEVPGLEKKRVASWAIEAQYRQAVTPPTI